MICAFIGAHLADGSLAYCILKEPAITLTVKRENLDDLLKQAFHALFQNDEARLRHAVRLISDQHYNGKNILIISDASGCVSITEMNIPNPEKAYSKLLKLRNKVMRK